jgi:hypothetical protein
VYRRFRERLVDELGVAPSPALQRLQGEILRQSRDLDWSPPSGTTVRTDSRTPGNLADRRTDLVGRDRDLAELLAAVRDTRVVTVLGVGGVGKTLLALHAAAAAAEEYADGTWLVELAAAQDPSAVVDAISTTLAVQQRAGLDGTARLVEFLRPKQLLLVLDNCEHLIEAAAAAVEAISDGCPAVTGLSDQPRTAPARSRPPIRPVSACR